MKFGIKKVLYLLIFTIILTGCTNTKEDNNETKYESINYAQKGYEAIEQYQSGDLTSKEVNEKLETLSSSIEAIKEKDKDLYIKIVQKKQIQKYHQI